LTTCIPEPWLATASARFSCEVLDSFTGELSWQFRVLETRPFMFMKGKRCWYLKEEWGNEAGRLASWLPREKKVLENEAEAFVCGSKVNHQ
jgi:hypothetical protein